MEILIVLVVLTVIGFGAYYGWKHQQQRKKDLAALAARLGLRYSERDPYGLSRKFGAWFSEFNSGSDRYAYNVLVGRTGEHELWVFDHHHETHTTDSKGNRQTHHHHMTCLLLQHDLDLGVLRLRPEHLFDKLKAAFGFDDIDFESAEFSRRFHVSGEDRKLAYDVFHPRMIEYLLKRTHLTLAMQGTLLLARRGSAVMKIAQIEGILLDALGFLERLPRYLKKDRAAEG